MGNLTDAQGTLTFENSLYKKYKSLIDDFLTKSKFSGYNADYGICEINKINDNEFEFIGSGNWSMSNVFPYAFEPVDSNDPNTNLKQLKSKYLDLMTNLENEESYILAEYTDYDSSCGTLIEETSKLTPLLNNDDHYIFDVDIQETNDVDLTDRNRVANGLEDGYDLTNETDLNNFKELLDDYYQTLKSPKLSKVDFIKEVLHCIRVDPELDNGIQEYKIEDDMLYETLKYDLDIDF